MDFSIAIVSVCIVTLSKAQENHYGPQDFSPTIDTTYAEYPSLEYSHQEFEYAIGPPIDDRQSFGGSILDDPVATAIVALGVGGAIIFGIGFADAGIRRNAIKTDLESANARIGKLESDFDTVCSNIQGILDTILNFEAAVLSTPSLIAAFVPPQERRNIDIKLEGRQDDAQFLASLALESIRAPLPASACATS